MACTKKLVHELRTEKRVWINGKPAQWTSRLNGGDTIEINLPHEMNDTVNPLKYPLQVLYEDDHLLVVNKPARMSTHINDSNEDTTLANAVAYYLESKGDCRKIRHAHRLDKDTTGAIIFAKHALSHALLDRMLQNDTVERSYLALADGTMKNNTFTINEPIGRDRHHPTRRRVSKTGQHAVTHCRVLNTFSKEKLTLIECSLETGRTHQIRVHMSHIGFPLAGDQDYGGSSFFSRQALHARKLSFTHPLTLEPIECIAPFLDTPPIFDSFIR